MRPLQLIHCVVTAVLVVVLVSLGLLFVTGIVEIRSPRNADGQRKLAERILAERIEENGAPIRGRLVVVRGAKPGMEYRLHEGENFVGRADEKAVDVDLEFQESPDRVWSSRQHACITCGKSEATIEDLNSSNGTYVNRSRVPPGQKRRLENGDIIQIGEVQLKVGF
jgi:FHA domain